ncbi:UDP-N-acetylmuramate--L-alanine ligase [Agrococcus jejuensis]|uniref:UDP-N-acetylmuramate--L-alanine ligase n=1 Tax=Agrococcus jejuensis TaxID=399736 RepID=A0A1G8A9J7_9MICO|nr:UDP-N-acetylmuramate--L-alanine ligase [Agrococcus jejuensis]SDH17695.1 UDP-N-acetylmuramate--L-alanine ligase [Agrococcus jejuensis]
MIEPDLTQPIPEGIERVHMIGIGGSGMSGIAHMLLDEGVRVSGSDRSGSATVDALVTHGATVAVGHDAANLPADVDAVVVTSALWPTNPELVAAQERGIPVLHRSQALHLLARGKRLVAVAGAHGKTTSTGMVVWALHRLDAGASYVNGGTIAGLGGSSGHGPSDLFVLEADESDGSFLLYDVAVALVTNVDTDHLDHYGTPGAFDAAFAQFADAASEAVVISSDDAGARRVRDLMHHERVVTFGEREDADVRVVEVETGAGIHCVVEHAGERHAIAMDVVGHHNAVNAAGAFAVLLQLGIAPAAAAEALSSFAGTGRRFESHGERRGVRVYDDYAHHPAEVEAALAGARTVLGGGRLIAVHQPHLYSRTRDMATEFAAAYERLADHTIVLDVYGAREDPIPGVTGALVSNAFADDAKVDFLPDWQAAADRVGEIAQDGDLVMTLSCGDVYRIIPQLLESLEATDGDG